MINATSLTIYSRLIKLTRRGEDFFTECLAFALQEDETFCRSFLKILAGPEIGGISIDNASIHLETQKSFKSSRIDLLITLNNSFKIAVENKIRADEGEDQLAKYLKLDEIHLLAFITAEKGYDIDVVKHPKYIRPPEGDHFIWGDFIGIIEELSQKKDASYSIKGMIDLYNHFTLKPRSFQNDEIVNELVAFMKTDETRKDLNHLFAKYHWKNDKVNKNNEIYAYPQEPSGLKDYFSRIFIKPTKDGNALSIKFTVKHIELLNDVLRNFEKAEIEFSEVAIKKDNVQYVVLLGDFVNNPVAAGKDFFSILTSFMNTVKKL